ncbi:[protein-PII] uridylyltransferase [Myxococcota bacterium]|nr:[protein-PII] uridylyltransferase [Myxococcota bacterium]MBU1430267.1 [protein-PII] uridylyltransferase [Myxococcota bacterium]
MQPPTRWIDEGLDGARALSARRDALVREVYARHDLTTPLLALGGYGHEILSPRSDLDLLFLEDDPAQPALLKALWDEGLQIGYATRDAAASLALAAEDLHTATALLSARALSEHPALAAALRRDARAALRARAAAFMEQLNAGRQRRHARYGGSVYLLEPNLKQSPGGLRELDALFWASAVVYEIDRWADLPQRLGLEPKAAAELLAARAALIALRFHLHQRWPHGGDRLTFARQERLALELGYGEGREGVERFMAHYYARATTARRWAALVFDRCAARLTPDPPPVRRALDARFRQVGRRLALRAGALERDPRVAWQLFSEARRRGMSVAPESLELILSQREALTLDARRRRRDTVAAQALLDVLCQPDPDGLLEQLHGAGLIGALIPEFARVTHRVHHDLYHVYTVDAHTLKAIERIKALQAGALAEEEPLLTQAMGYVEHPQRLYLATLLHDIGKAIGPGHAVQGARRVPTISRRLGLTMTASLQVTWLVRDHLSMIHLSQRGDLSDEALIRELGRRVGDQAGLAMLFILSWADASTTGPQAWGAWKAALLCELYARCTRALRQGLDLYQDPEHTVERRRRAVTRWLLRRADPRLRDVGGAVERFFGALPTAYFQRSPARDIARHMEMLERLKDHPVRLEIAPRPRRGYAYVHAAAAQPTGLLSAVAGVLALHGLHILSADLYVVAEAHALDILRVRDDEGAPSDDPEAWARPRADLERALKTPDWLWAEVAARRAPEGRFEWPPPPPVETQILIEHHPARTILEVHAGDRLGLLYTLAREIEGLPARIRLARISTANDAAHDTFFLESMAGGPLDEDASAALYEALSRALG